ncbi:MAG: hypothetical protein OXN81_13830 [Alphaproteobacteria bacterium]|nr:hypothetical protein [Alphaproteobacteria bacterium]
MAPRPTSRAGIEEQNRLLLDRYRHFRLAADAVTAAWQFHPHVMAVSLIGSVARDPWKEVPCFTPYRRARIELWHECKDLDLALWLSDLSDLNALRRKSAAAVRKLMERRRIGVAAHQVDVFILEPGTDRYLGRLCAFNACPKGKRECLVPGCGDMPFLRQHDEFEWWADTLAPGRAVRLFDRASGTVATAASLPLPETAESG